MTKLVILDRDGVINEDSDEFIKSVEEWRPIPGSLEAIAKLNRAGYCVAVATNQSGLARGLFDMDTLQAMHRRMQSELAEHGGHLEGIFFCPHGPNDNCDCRKPKPGLFQRIEQLFGSPLEHVMAVGDSARDILAARAAGAQPVLVRTGKGQRTLSDSRNDLAGVPVYDDLAAAVNDLLEIEENQ